MKQSNKNEDSDDDLFPSGYDQRMPPPNRVDMTLYAKEDDELSDILALSQAPESEQKETKVSLKLRKMGQHQKLKHLMKPKISKEGFQCGFCDKVFKNKKLRDMHVKLHPKLAEQKVHSRDQGTIPPTSS